MAPEFAIFNEMFFDAWKAIFQWKPQKSPPALIRIILGMATPH
jgi:hypothetical protein